MEDQQEGASFEAEVGGQKFAARGLRDVNTIFTILTFCAVLGGGAWIITTLAAHAADTRDVSMGWVTAIKEQTAATREQTRAAVERNCLDRYSVDQRPANADFCKALAATIR